MHFLLVQSQTQVHHYSVRIYCFYALFISTFIPVKFTPHLTPAHALLLLWILRLWPLRADHVSVKVCVGSGTAWDVSALWCPGLRRPPLPFSRSASDPLTPPPGTQASVPASQAQFYFSASFTLVCLTC